MTSILKLTPRRISIYEYILKFKTDHDGIAPTVSEICAGCGVSSKSIVVHDLETLVVLGMIRCEYGNGKSRMISIPGARWLPPSSSTNSPVRPGARVKLSSVTA